MDLKLKGKTGLVTGASAGLGRAIAKELAAEGVKLCIAARRRELLEQLAREVVAAGGLQPQIAIVDLMEERAPQKLAQEALEGLGQINILINCAGGSHSMSIDTPDEKWLQAMTLNFTQMRRLTLAVVRDMIKHKWGRIINITGKSEPMTLLSASSAKAAAHSFAKALSREVGKYGITVNSIAPGRIMSEQVRRRHSDEWISEHAAREIPLGRYGEPEDLACLAAFLASPIAGYITGAVVPVDGGMRRFAF